MPHSTQSQFVAAVETEEECNTFRKSLQRRVDDGLSTLLSFPNEHEFDFQDIQDIEVSMLIGVLEWVLKTKGLLLPFPFPAVWALASILSQINFNVQSSSVII